MQGFMILAMIGTEKDTKVFYSTCFTGREIMTKSMEGEMYVQGIWSWCVLVEYVKDNYYARFHENPSYQRYRERHFSVLLDMKF